MAHIARSVVIDRPLELVFNYVVAQWEGHLGFWSRGIESWSPSPAPLRAGFRVHYIARMLGIGMPVEMEVVHFERPRGWIAESRQGPAVRGEWHFAALEHGTRFTYHLAYRMPPPLLGPLADRLVLRRLWERNIEQSLANLQRLLEGAAQGAA
jgi:hypothetical protein